MRDLAPKPIILSGGGSKSSSRQPYPYLGCCDPTWGSASTSRPNLSDIAGAIPCRAMDQSATCLRESPLVSAITHRILRIPVRSVFSSHSQSPLCSKSIKRSGNQTRDRSNLYWCLAIVNKRLVQRNCIITTPCNLLRRTTSPMKLANLFQQKNHPPHWLRKTKANFFSVEHRPQFFVAVTIPAVVPAVFLEQLWF